MEDKFYPYSLRSPRDLRSQPEHSTYSDEKQS